MAAKFDNCETRRGKSQKELLRDSTVELRSYQRAEQGLAISPAVLREIAGLFKLPLADIVCKPDGDRGARSETVRLHPCDGKGGLKILSRLQCPVELRVGFDVDPYGDTATLIADMIRCCKINSYSDASVQLEDAEFIEAVGELNTKIAELYAVGVNIHFATYTRWETSMTQLPTGEAIRTPTCRSCLHILFSEQSWHHRAAHERLGNLRSSLSFVPPKQLGTWHTSRAIELSCSPRGWPLR